MIFINPNLFSERGNQREISPRGKENVSIFSKDFINDFLWKGNDNVIGGMGLARSSHYKINSGGMSSWIK